MDLFATICEVLLTCGLDWDRDDRSEGTPWQTWVVTLIWIVVIALVVWVLVWLFR